VNLTNSPPRTVMSVAGDSMMVVARDEARVIPVLTLMKAQDDGFYPTQPIGARGPEMMVRALWSTTTRPTLDPGRSTVTPFQEVS
jgi:hypothetical protein